MKNKEKILGKIREKPIPEEKKEIVKEIVKKISNSKTVLIASCKGLPGQQFHEIKKKLRSKAEILVAKKSAIFRSIDEIEKGAVKNLKEKITADIVLLFSDLEVFELSSLLSENQSPAFAKTGDLAPHDIEIEPGPTDLIPGPAISELGSVGLKVAVKEGKLEIMKGAVVVKEGQEIDGKVASVLAKLNIKPMKVGFMPVAAYDSTEDKFYVDIIVDKVGTLEALRNLIGKALGFATKIEYLTSETIKYLIMRASAEEKALSKFVKEENLIEEKKVKKTEEISEKKGSEESNGQKSEDKDEEKNKESDLNKQDSNEGKK
jgi:large subunit ribosomal protein L10